MQGQHAHLFDDLNEPHVSRHCYVPGTAVHPLYQNPEALACSYAIPACLHIFEFDASDEGSVVHTAEPWMGSRPLLALC